jgi:hypothetical protein
MDAFFSHVTDIDNLFQQLSLALDDKNKVLGNNFLNTYSVLHAVNEVYKCMLLSATHFRLVNHRCYFPDNVCQVFLLANHQSNPTRLSLGPGNQWSARQSHNNAQPHSNLSPILEACKLRKSPRTLLKTREKYLTLFILIV